MYYSFMYNVFDDVHMNSRGVSPASVVAYTLCWVQH